MHNSHEYGAFFAEEATRLGSSLYAHLARTVSQDINLQPLAAQGRPGPPMRISYSARSIIFGLTRQYERTRLYDLRPSPKPCKP